MTSAVFKKLSAAGLLAHHSAIIGSLLLHNGAIYGIFAIDVKAIITDFQQPLP